MTKFNLILLNYFEVSKIADLVFVTLLNGEKKIEVTYNDFCVFTMYRTKDIVTDNNVLEINLVATNDKSSLSDTIYLDLIDINSARIAFAMMNILAIHFKDNREHSIKVREIASFDVPKIKKKKRKD